MATAAHPQPEDATPTVDMLVALCPACGKRRVTVRSRQGRRYRPHTKETGYGAAQCSGSRALVPDVMRLSPLELRTPEPEHYKTRRKA